jgi:hypothetical protein
MVEYIYLNESSLSALERAREKGGQNLLHFQREVG